MAEKTTLFLCKCGANIADFVDLNALEAWAQQNEGVDHVCVHDFLCAPAGKEFIEATLKANGSKRAVMAACSPKLHQKTFEEVGALAALNPAQITMANIREQCAWVTPDKAQATEKARTLIQAALNRSVLNVDLPKLQMECNTDMVVIGGGIAGIEAALQAAEAGRKVTLFEKEISIGGELIKVEEIAPMGECAPCLLAPRISAIRDNPNIRIVSGALVTDVLGFFGNFTVIAKQKARFVTDACIGCEACFEPCPVDVQSTFHLGMGTHKAIYTLFPGSEPVAAAIDQAHCLHLQGKECQACVDNCPFGAIDFEQKDEIVEVKCGTVVIAIGAEVYAPKDIPRLGLNGTNNVYTYAEFERLSCSNGPSQAKLVLRNGETPQSLAVLHCAGSLCSDGLSYCSGVCCVNALMAGDTIRKQLPDIKIINIHNRLALVGAEQEHLLRHQVHSGTQMLYCQELEQVEIQEQASGQLLLKIPGSESILVDMVVLSTGLKPGDNAKKLASICNAELDSYGFFKSDHPILNATGSVIDGIAMAGSCVQPSHSPQSVVMAQAAVGRALSRLIPGRTIELETMVSHINAEICAGCKMCIPTCPYKAIRYDSEKKSSLVNEAICRGCGTCAATCPSNAITARHFTNEQLLAEVKGVIHG